MNSLIEYFEMEKKRAREEYEEYHKIYRDALHIVKDINKDEETADKIREIWYKGILEGYANGHINYGKIMIDIMNCNKKEG